MPYHGAKEIPEPLRRKIAKGMGVKWIVSSYNISKWRDYGKDYNEYLCELLKEKKLEKNKKINKERTR